MGTNITLFGDLWLWFPAVFRRIENLNQMSQVTGQGYIFTYTTVVKIIKHNFVVWI